MKILLSIIISTMTVSTVAQAAPTECLPQGNSNWLSASIDRLEGSAHSVQHVKAYGIFLVADMLCSFKSCTGFVNGVKTEGTIELASGKLKKITISGDTGLSMEEFICE